MTISVTELIKRYSRPFDPDGKILARKAKELEMDPADVRKMWSEKGKVSTQKGEIVHGYIEHLFTGSRILYERIPEFDAADKVYKFLLEEYEVEKWECYTPDNKWGVTGRADVILKNRKENIHTVVDWKTGNLNNTSFGNMIDEFSDVPESKELVALVQAALYKKLFETEDAMVVHLPENGPYRILFPDKIHFSVADRLLATLE